MIEDHTILFAQENEFKLKVGDDGRLKFVDVKEYALARDGNIFEKKKE